MGGVVWLAAGREAIGQCHWLRISWAGERQNRHAGPGCSRFNQGAERQKGRQHGEEANRSADDVSWFAIGLPQPEDQGPGSEAGREGVEEGEGGPCPSDSLAECVSITPSSGRAETRQWWCFYLA